jgi:bacterioferritin-associated ferredoxin
MVLVVAIMYLFMQNLRATLVPAIAVPVVLLGTMGVLAVAGFSINTLTMFGLVLAIGLLVDDAIVVVENVERLMREEGLSPREATKAQHGRNQWRAGGHRRGAVGGVHPDGLLRRLHRRHLPPVQHHRGECHGAVGAGGDELSPALCATCSSPCTRVSMRHGGPLGRCWTGSSVASTAASTAFTERYVGQVGWLSARRGAASRCSCCSWPARLVVQDAAHQLPARRGPGRPADPGAHGAGRHQPNAWRV